MAVMEAGTQTGLFSFDLFIGSSFGASHYCVSYFYSIAGSPFVTTDDFDLVIGGSPDGDVTSMYFYDRPHAKFVVHGLSTGRILKGKNPQI